jgi:transmembrane sensor
MEGKELYQIIEKHLADEINSEEQSRLDAWLGHSPENRKFLEEMELYWDLTGKLEPDISIDSNSAFDNLKEDMGKTSIKANVRKLWVYRWAASILLIAVVGFIFYVLKHRTVKTEFSTLNNTAQIELSDGSKILLNKYSTLKYPKDFKEDRREVYLSGEGFFEVERNEKAPFIIKAENTEIIVLGTSFNVNAYLESNTIEVTVKTGKVGFYKTSESDEMVILEAGDHATFNKNRNIISREESTDLGCNFSKVLNFGKVTYLRL